jgi:peptidoglycan hydrolase-like protein with peptidoglycan-binding domain
MKLEEIIEQNKVTNLDTLTSDNELIKEIQTNLSALGLLQVSSIDGVFGPITEAALKRFCEAFHLNNMSTGQFGSTFAKKLIDTRGPLVTPLTNLSTGASTDKLAIVLKFTLEWEGGYVDHTNDLGGATNKGITQTTYNSYRIRKQLPTQRVRNITDDEVHEIYNEMFWQPSQAELMVLPLAVVHFDTAVLFGVGGAIKFLQEALEIPADGGFGPQTKSILEANNNHQTAMKMIDRRVSFHKERVTRNPSQGVFLDGWLSRVNEAPPTERIGLREFINNL